MSEKDEQKKQEKSKDTKETSEKRQPVKPYTGTGKTSPKEFQKSEPI